VKTAQQAAANWSGSSGRATTAYTEGVQNTNKDQAALAVAAEARLLSNFQQSVTSGRWRNGVMAGGTGYWKSQTLAKAANFGVGITAGTNNYTAAAQKIMQAIGTGVGQLPPRGDINQNLQRSASLALYLHSLKGQLGAR
jgi:hypothetical protein